MYQEEFMEHLVTEKMHLDAFLLEVRPFMSMNTIFPSDN